MSQRGTASATLILLSMLCTAAESQDTADAPYQPLFTDAMINSAAPEQRERMRAAEENNRQAYERRQKADKEAAAAATAPASAAPAPPARSRRSKIYKWVDNEGRVHFGDAPAGKGAEEITIKGAGASPPSRPAPDSRGTPPSPFQDNPTPGSGDSRNQRRGS